MKFSVVLPLFTRRRPPISRKAWTRTTWSRSAISSGNCPSKGNGNKSTLQSRQRPLIDHLCMCLLRRPFRPSLSSITRISSSLKPVQEVSLLGDNLLKDITLVGGNDSGLFISSVQPGSGAERAGLREGHHLLMVRSFQGIQFSLRRDLQNQRNKWSN